MAIHELNAKRIGRALELLTMQVAIGNTETFPGGGGQQLYDVILSAESMDYDLDIKKLWVGENRWRLLTRQYVNGEGMDDWLMLIRDNFKDSKKPHGVAHLRSSKVKSKKTGKGVTRKWGSCMLGWSFRMLPEPTFTMYSRSTYLGYLAGLDLGVGVHLAEKIAEMLDLEDMRFNWHIEQATFHAFRSLAWWYTTPSHEMGLRTSQSYSAHKARRIVGRFEKMDAEGVLYGDMAYAQERRFRMKWHSERGIDVTPFLGVGKKAEVKANPPLPSKSLWDLVIVPGTNSTGEEADEDE